MTDTPRILAAGGNRRWCLKRTCLNDLVPDPLIPNPSIHPSIYIHPHTNTNTHTHTLQVDVNGPEADPVFEFLKSQKGGEIERGARGGEQERCEGAYRSVGGCLVRPRPITQGPHAYPSLPLLKAPHAYPS